MSQNPSAAQPVEDFETVRDGIHAQPPDVFDIDASVRAAVALILRRGVTGLELLFIRRAELAGDRWSGDIAFPGGRVGAADRGVRETAERETLEELALDLSAAAPLGRLDDLRGRSESILVSAFVYGVDETGPLVPNAEVREVFWVPLSILEDPARQRRQSFAYLGTELELPAIRVLDGEDAPMLWGLTYRFLELLLSRIGRRIPSMAWSEPD